MSTIRFESVDTIKRAAIFPLVKRKMEKYFRLESDYFEGKNVVCCLELK